MDLLVKPLPDKSQMQISKSESQLFLSFPPEDTTVSARISDCLADISTWMKNHHLQLNLAKTELMVFPAKQDIHHNTQNNTRYLFFSSSQTDIQHHSNIKINTDSLSLAPSKTARNLGVIIDDQLTFTAHIACLQVVPLCAIQHPQNQAVPNPVCHPAAGANLG